MISGISVEQVIDHVATTPESVERSASAAQVGGQRVDQSGHHAVPTCRRGDLSALGHVGFPTEDDVAEGCVQRSFAVSFMTLTDGTSGWISRASASSGAS